MVSQLHVFNSCSRQSVLVRVLHADLMSLVEHKTKDTVHGKIDLNIPSTNIGADGNHSQESTYKGMDITPDFVRIAPKDFLRWDGSKLFLTVKLDDGTSICKNYEVPDDRSVIVKENGIILSKYGNIYTGEDGKHYY